MGKRKKIMDRRNFMSLGAIAVVAPNLENISLVESKKYKKCILIYYDTPKLLSSVIVCKRRKLCNHPETHLVKSAVVMNDGRLYVRFYDSYFENGELIIKNGSFVYEYIDDWLVEELDEDGKFVKYLTKKDALIRN